MWGALIYIPFMLQLIFSFMLEISNSQKERKKINPAFIDHWLTVSLKTFKKKMSIPSVFQGTDEKHIFKKSSNLGEELLKNNQSGEET